MQKITVTFHNLGELPLGNQRPLVDIFTQRVPGFIGLCEVPLAGSKFGQVTHADSEMEPMLSSLRDASGVSLTSSFVPMHNAFAVEGRRFSGLGIVSSYTVQSATFHPLPSPDLRKGDWRLHDKGVLRITIVVDGRKLTLCVLHLPPAHRFGSRLDAPEFQGMRRGLRKAVEGADVVLGDFNNRGMFLADLEAGLEGFIPVWQGETRQGLEEQVDWVLYKAATFPGGAETTGCWSTDEHGVVGADLIL